MARKTGSINHTHQYFKLDNGLWGCMKDGCTHYQPKNMAPKPIGCKSICWGCDIEFVIHPYNMRDDHPKCDECTERHDAVMKFMEEKMPDRPESSFKGPIERTMERLRSKQSSDGTASIPSNEEDKPESEDV